jgi:hypothetical protein
VMKALSGGSDAHTIATFDSVVVMLADATLCPVEM